MVDAVEIERQGKPTVTIVHDAFERAARLHARALGLPDLPLLVEPTPRGGTISFDVEDFAQEAIAAVLQALTAARQTSDVTA